MAKRKEENKPGVTTCASWPW